MYLNINRSDGGSKSKLPCEMKLNLTNNCGISSFAIVPQIL
jgi:hypothetical protein